MLPRKKTLIPRSSVVCFGIIFYNSFNQIFTNMSLFLQRLILTFQIKESDSKLRRPKINSKRHVLVYINTFFSLVMEACII